MSDLEQRATDLKEVLRRGQQGLADGAAADDWLRAVRDRGAADVQAMARPDRKQEAWRYTPVSFLDKAEYRPLVEGPFGAIQPADVEELMLGEQQGTCLVFVNGYYAPALSRLAPGQQMPQIAVLSGQLGDVPAQLKAHLDGIAEHHHVFAALNSALMSDGALLYVPQSVSVPAPIEILHISVGLDEPGICHPRHLIVLEAEAQAQVIERYCALGEAVYFNNALIEVVLGPGSTLSHERLQEESALAQHLSDLHVRLDKGSHYKHAGAALGGAWSRTDLRLNFAGEGAQADLDGLMLARDKQLNDVHLDVQHTAPGCISRESFKGILDGRGKVVFDGRILVAQDAQQTDASLSNHNLMLSRSAEVDTKPQLEIYADDVKCSHGTTVGELDHNMLFYLRSRGIPSARARQMLCQGFAEEILDRMENPALHGRAARLLAERLATYNV